MVMPLKQVVAPQTWRSAARQMITSTVCAALFVVTMPSLALSQSAGAQGSYYHDQVDIPGCPQPIAVRLPEPFLPVSKSLTLTNFLNEQLVNNTFSAVYQSTFYVHQQWAVPSTISIGIMNRDERMQGSFTEQDFKTINARIAEGLTERSGKVRNYLSYIEKTRPAELEAARYLFNNTFYLNPRHFIFYDISTVNISGLYNVQKLNAANFIYVDGCILFASVEVIDNLTNFYEFHSMNAELSVGNPQPDTPRFGFVDKPETDDR